MGNAITTLGIRTFEGYGVTECAPLIAANHLGGRKVGTVGRPLITVRLVGAQGEEVGYGDPATGTYRGSGGQVGTATGGRGAGLTGAQRWWPESEKEE